MYWLIFVNSVAVVVDTDRWFGALVCFRDYEVWGLDSGVT